MHGHQPGRSSFETRYALLRMTDETATASTLYKIACGRKRDVLPVIGFSSSRIDSPQGV